MTEDNQDSLWPMPKFYFMVNFGSAFSASFQEVSGLDTEPQDEASLSYTFRMVDTSGKDKVTLKNGTFVNKDHFRKWHHDMKVNTIKPISVTIQLLDENESPSLTWTLINARISRITGTDLEAESSVSTIESLELRHEGITTG